MLCDGATTVIKTYLRNVDVGLLGSHEVGLVAPMPLDQEVQFPGLLRGSEDLLRLQSSGKSSRLVSPFRLLSWSINNWLSLINQHRMYVDKPLPSSKSSMILLDLPRRIDLGLLLALSVISVMSAAFHEPAI